MLMHMLEIVCAIYSEAVPFIKNLGLKKSSFIRGCDSFVDEDQRIRLTLTGVGKVKAASAVSLLLNQSEDPYLLSYGSAFGYHKGVFLANRILDIDTGFSCYPDMIFSSSLKETTFLTGSRLLSSTGDTRVKDHMLYDMESSAIYEAASRFIGPHQMMFVRFVSDADASKATAQSVIGSSQEAYPFVNEMIDQILSFQKKDFPIHDEAAEVFSEKIHASHSMEHALKQIIRYAQAISIDYQSIMKELTTEEIKSKEEGKKVFDEFRKRICE